MPISIYDTTTPIEDLREEYGWASTEENLQALVMVLCARVAALTARVEKLEAASAPDLPEECRNQKCDYYRHYLISHDPAINGPRLEHAAYHHAAERCEIAQQAVIRWLDQHQDDPKAIEPPHLERQASYWEKKICA